MPVCKSLRQRKKCALACRQPLSDHLQRVVLGTAKLNGLDPAAWLKNTLEKLPTCRNSDIDDLLLFRATKPARLRVRRW
jgi:hypothetical protein